MISLEKVSGTPSALFNLGLPLRSATLEPFAKINDKRFFLVLLKYKKFSV